jgi:hypothetical protein
MQYNPYQAQAQAQAQSNVGPNGQQGGYFVPPRPSKVSIRAPVANSGNGNSEKSNTRSGDKDSSASPQAAASAMNGAYPTMGADGYPDVNGNGHAAYYPQHYNPYNGMAQQGYYAEQGWQAQAQGQMYGNGGEYYEGGGYGYQ